jgi:hypothetical protein
MISKNYSTNHKTFDVNEKLWMQGVKEESIKKTVVLRPVKRTSPSIACLKAYCRRRRREVDREQIH